MFVGVFEHKTDANGRVALPASFRDALGSECFLRRHPDGSLKVLDGATYREEAQSLRARVQAGEVDEDELAELGESTTRVAIDKNGRVTLDADALGHAGIEPGGMLTFAGNVFWIAIWSPDGHAAQAAARQAAKRAGQPEGAAR